jgi:hypothetical protein
MVRVLSLSAVVLVFATACSTGPTTKQEVCEAYQELGTEFAGATGVYANGVFREAGDLSSVADRYEGGASLKSDAAALEKISDSKETDARELANATAAISTLCGKSLISAVATGWK